MSKIKIELDAYVIPGDHKVWKCFPGKTYRFYEIVRQAQVVFLDIRGLETLNKDPSVWVDSEVLKVIAADRWARELSRQSPSGKQKGSADISRTDKRNLTFLKGLLLHAKKGDLIVLPAEGYRKEALIGEIIDDSGEVVKHTAQDGDKTYVYIGRRVRWRATQEKRLFSRELIDLLHTQTAFFSLPKSIHEEVYRIAYKNFIVGDVYAATFSTSKEHFSTSDSALTGMWFNALAAVRDAVENNTSIAGKDYFDLVVSRSVGSADNEIEININSPGEYLLRSLGAFALVVMAMLPLSDVTAKDILKSEIKVELKTVGTADQSCALKIEEAIQEYARTLSVQRLQKSCEIGKRARSEATIDTKARLKSTTGKTN